MSDDVLVWDYEVRSILRRHLGPDHLRRYHEATELSPNEQQDLQASTAALGRALVEMRASSQAVQKKMVVPSGGLSDAWWFRTAGAAFITAIIGAIIALAVNQFGVDVPSPDGVPSLEAGDAPSFTSASNSSFGTVQNIVEDPGKVVELTPTVEPTPISSPTPTPDLPDSQKPVINPPPDPDEDQPDDEAEGHFLDGVTALTDGDFPAAVKAFEAAIETEPGFVRAYYNLGIAYENLGTEEANQAAIKSYTAAIELWNSLDSDGDGLLFEAKLGRGLLLVSFSTDEQAICSGRTDLLEYLERGDVSPRNLEAVNKALAGIEVDCVGIEKIS